MKKKLRIGILIAIVAIQFIRIDKTNPAVIAEQDYLTQLQPDEKVANLIKNACYDCHSNTTEYPWYSNVAPISWWIKDHIDHGRKHLNFSVWSTYSEKKQHHKIDECVEMLEDEEMPLKSFTITHPEAVLSEEEREMLIAYFKSQL